MSKYKVGDKVVVEITAVSRFGESYEVAKTSQWSVGRTERVAEPLGNYTEPLEAKIRRQAAEITRLLRENKELKWEKAKEEIKAGDVYMSQVGNYFVIYGVDREKDIAKILWTDLSISARKLDDIKEYYIKTGRHIDIDSFLREIGEE